MSSIYYYTNSPYGGSPIDGGKNNDKKVEKQLREEIAPTVVIEGATVVREKPKEW